MTHLTLRSTANRGAYALIELGPFFADNFENSNRWHLWSRLHFVSVCVCLIFVFLFELQFVSPRSDSGCWVCGCRLPISKLTECHRQKKSVMCDQDRLAERAFLQAKQKEAGDTPLPANYAVDLRKQDLESYKLEVELLMS